jgi:hypothetical protein
MPDVALAIAVEIDREAWQLSGMNCTWLHGTAQEPVSA